jgi:hypothetical protein
MTACLFILDKNYKDIQSYEVMKTGCFANVELIIWPLIWINLNQSPSMQIWLYSCKKMEYECKCLLYDLPKCTWGRHTKILVVRSYFKLSIWNFAHTLWALSELQPEWWLELWPFSCISKMVVEKDQLVLSLYFLLPDLMCYILLHSIHISTNFNVFPFKWQQ